MTEQRDDNAFLVSLRDEIVGRPYSKYRGNGIEPLVKANRANLFGIYTDLFPADPLWKVLESERRRILKEALSTLTLQQKTVIILHFGLADGVVHTLEEIGAMLGVTRERVRQVEAKALRKMRHPVIARKLQHLLI